MTIVHFSAQGTCWRVTPVTHEESQQPHVPALPGAGLLFTSADAEIRFLPLMPDSRPSREPLERTSMGELAKMVQRAQPLLR
jgi:hypothetical protein